MLKQNNFGNKKSKQSKEEGKKMFSLFHRQIFNFYAYLYINLLFM